MKSAVKKSIALLCILGLSLGVAADCNQSCQEAYEECLAVSQSASAEKICGSQLRECRLKCATNVE